MWEYVRIWHRANWIGFREADGWDRWVTLPDDVEAPPPDATDSAALNFMGRRSWELVHVELLWDLPSGTTNIDSGAQRHRYYFKRRLDPT